MKRLTIFDNGHQIGSFFVWENGTVELHAADRDRFLAALGEAYTALMGRDCARTLQDARSADSGAVGVEHGT